MYTIVFVGIVVFNIVVLSLIIFINNKMIELLTSYIYLRRISNISIKKEIVIVTFGGISTVILYAVSYAIMLMGLLPFER